MSATILVLDHNQQRQREIGSAVERMHHRPLAAFTVREAKQLFNGQFYAIDLIIVNLDTRDLEIDSFLTRAQQILPDIPVIILGTPEDQDTIAMTLDRGAHDYLHYPLTPERLQIVIRNALRISWLWKSTSDWDHQQVGLSAHAFIDKSSAMRKFRDKVSRIGNTAVFCLSIAPATPEESVLDYLVRSFKPSASLFRLRRGDPKPDTDQPAVLVVEAPEDWKPEELAPLLSPADGHWHVFHCTLGKSVPTLSKLQDIPFPRLSERREDIDGLVDHALRYAASRPGGRALSLSNEVRSAFKRYDWPGGVRELNNMLLRAQLTTHEDILLPTDFPEIFADQKQKSLVRGEIREGDIFTYRGGQEFQLPTAEHKPQDTPADDAGPFVMLIDPEGELRPIEAIERDCILHALIMCDNNISAAAKALGIGRATLYRKLKSFGVHI